MNDSRKSNRTCLPCTLYILLLIGGLWAFGAFWLAYTHTPTGEFGQGLVVFYFLGLFLYWLVLFVIIGIDYLMRQNW